MIFLQPLYESFIPAEIIGPCASFLVNLFKTSTFY